MASRRFCEVAVSGAIAAVVRCLLGPTPVLADTLPPPPATGVGSITQINLTTIEPGSNGAPVDFIAHCQTQTSDGSVWILALGLESVAFWRDLLRDHSTGRLAQVVIGVGPAGPEEIEVAALPNPKKRRR
jgi:hypothetical protein